MIKQGAVKINGEKVLDSDHKITLNEEQIYQVGKKRFKRIKIAKKSPSRLSTENYTTNSQNPNIRNYQKKNF